MYKGYKYKMSEINDFSQLSKNRNLFMYKLKAIENTI